MKKIIPIIAIILIPFTILSCDSNLQPMEEGNVNYNIYPYLEFTLSPDRTYFIASVVEGAKLTTVSVPGFHHTDYGAMPIKEFAGFEDINDSINLEEVILDVHIEKVSEGAFDKAENLKVVKTSGDKEGPKWVNLPTLTREGYHFIGWKAGDTFVYNGMPIDPEHSEAIPVFEAHDYIMYPGKEPTCTEAGYKPYGVCRECGYSSYTVLPALGHDLIHIERKDPTCTEEGVIGHYICTRCGEKYTDIEATRPIGDVTIPKKPHSLYYVDAVEATCSQKGNMEHYRCYVCGGYFLDSEGEEEVTEEQVTLPVSDHVPDDHGWYSNEKNHFHQCKWCNEAIDVEEHTSNGGTVKVHPTLHEKGTMEYRCTVCNHTWQEDIREGDHVPVFKETVDPNCTERGYDIYVCGNEDCDAEVHTNYTDPLGHDAKYVPIIYATCTEDGVKAHYKCSRCDGIFWNEEAKDEVGASELVIPATGHDFDTSVWLSNDTHHWHPCKNTDKNTDIKCDAKGGEARHSHAIETVSEGTLKNAANCTSKAQYWKSCECGHVSDSEWFEYGKPLGHNITIHQEETDATCTEAGYHEYWYCSRCSLYFTDSAFTATDTLANLTKAPLGHDYQWVKTDPSEHWMKCTRCGDIKEETRGSHVYETKDGVTSCTVCGYLVVTGEGGFTPIIVDKRPIAHLTYTNIGTVFTFTLNDDKTANPPDKIEWYLDGRLTEETGWSFTFNAPYPMTYKVMCVYSNDYGKGSQTVVVNGG